LRFVLGAALRTDSDFRSAGFLAPLSRGRVAQQRRSVAGRLRERLGHRDPNITLAIYSHAVPADTRAAAKIWDDAMADVIDAGRKTAAISGTLAHPCATGIREGFLLEIKEVSWRGRRGSNPRPPT
jgi:hypothetical protein